MKIYKKKWSTEILAPPDVVWSFFADPANLEKITPRDMHFDILSDIGQVKMYPGMIIQYRVSPMAGIPLHWVTEITAVTQGEYFVDEQRSGPFSFWHHEHRFESTNDGVIMTDILHYAIPFGIIGRLVNSMMVSKRIDHIFEFRQKVINTEFTTRKAHSDKI